MSDLDLRLKKLREELDALQQIKTQEDFDEGARLHAAHNAPWVKGQYSHLEFPPYKFEAYPKMLYGLDYLEAVKARAQAELIPAFGARDDDRKAAILLADRRVALSTRIVKSEAEFRKVGEGWFETPGEVAEHFASLQRSIETAAAHRAYEDRNMSDKAKREIEAYDDQADHFVTHIPQQRRAPATRKRVKV